MEWWAIYIALEKGNAKIFFGNEPQNYNLIYTSSFSEKFFPPFQVLECEQSSLKRRRRRNVWKPKLRSEFLWFYSFRPCLGRKSVSVLLYSVHLVLVLEAVRPCTALVLYVQFFLSSSAFQYKRSKWKSDASFSLNNNSHSFLFLTLWIESYSVRYFSSSSLTKNSCRLSKHKQRRREDVQCGEEGSCRSMLDGCFLFRVSLSVFFFFFCTLKLRKEKKERMNGWGEREIEREE